MKKNKIKKDVKHFTKLLIYLFFRLLIKTSCFFNDFRKRMRIQEIYFHAWLNSIMQKKKKKTKLSGGRDQWRYSANKKRKRGRQGCV